MSPARATSNGAAVPNVPRLHNTGFVQLARLMTPDAAHCLAEELVQRWRRQRSPDGAAHGAFAVYADPILETLLRHTQPLLERIIAADLYPASACARVYERGSDVPSHADRSSREVCVSLTLGAEGGHRWPFWLECGGAAIEVGLGAGDAVMYVTDDCRHWRGALEAEWSAHVFLHYAFADTMFANLKGDQLSFRV